MAKRHPSVRWRPLSPYPYYLGFCDSQEAWDRWLRKHVKREEGTPLVVASAAAAAMTIVTDCGQKMFSVNVNREALGKDPAYVAGTLAHEATHIMQFIHDEIQEQSPGQEATAYMMGDIVEWLHRQYYSKD